jgi:outer membrane protein insertion porin family
MRSSYGLSIAWASPMGPIRLDFSRIAKREVYDRTQNFRFSFGTNF